MPKQYHRLYEDITSTMQTVRRSIKAWAIELGEIGDIDTFSTDVVRELYCLVPRIAEYEESIARRKAHRTRNYYTELIQAIDSLEKISETVFELHPNPLFNGEEAEAQKHRAILTDVFRFLVQKRMAMEINISKLEIGLREKIIEGHKSIIELYERHRALDNLGVNNDEKKASYERLKSFAKEHRQSSAQILEIASIEYLHTEKVKKRSTIRQEFVNTVAEIYLSYTKRADLSRTAEEKSKRAASPFKALLEICFDAIDERVTPAAMKKLIAEANRVIS